MSATNQAPVFKNGTGKVTTDIHANSDDFADIAITQVDGKILVAGRCNGKVTLLRYNTDGTLDNEFGMAGIVTSEVSGAASLCLQSDGKILVTGSTGTDFTAMRYSSAGSIDGTFGNAGLVGTDISTGSVDSAVAVAVQADGRVVVSGISSTKFWFGSTDVAVVRYTVDGVLDATFGNGGVVSTAVTANNDIATSVLLQTDGKVLVAGFGNGHEAMPDSVLDFILVRYNSDGTLDNSFGSGGKLIAALGLNTADRAWSMTLQPDGKILLAGESGRYSYSDFAVMRLNIDGSADLDFGSNGKVFTNFSETGFGMDVGKGVALQADGKILVSGYSNSNGSWEFALVRYNQNGTLDSSFDLDGRLTTTFGSSSSDYGASVTVQADGKIVVVGRTVSVSGLNGDVAIVRYNSDGSLDKSFGGASVTTLDGSISIYDPDMAVLSGGAGNYAGSTLVLARHGGPSVDDLFEGVGNLSLSNGSIRLSGAEMGSVVNVGGTLTLLFDANATQAYVDEALCSIGYQNAANILLGSIQIDWTFGDGNGGSQGTGGPLSATGSTLVGLSGINLPISLVALVALDLTGTSSSDLLSGNAGADTIDGGSGADRLIGSMGNDTYYVDTQGDIVFEYAGEGSDTVISSASFYLYDDIENLTLAAGAGDIYGSANALDNTLTGNEGNNLLLGWDGNDTIDAGAGNDILYGVEGNDALLGGAGIDVLVGGNGADTLDGGADSDAVFGQDGNDVLYGGTGFATDILIGGDGNDTLDGSASLASGQLRNQGDYDLMDGGAGDDVYYVDTPADLTFEAAGGGTDTVIADINGGGYYLYANMENLTLTGNTPFGVGNELNNILTGSELSNWLLGGAGDDTLNGNGGNDVLFGESGADIFVFQHGSGGDVVGDFAHGVDHIDLVGIGFASFAQVQAHMVENGGTTAIDLGQGDFVVLVGVAMNTLIAANFNLNPP